MKGPAAKMPSHASHSLLCLALLALVAVAPCTAKSYKMGEEIALYANKVGPFQNPTETYR